MAVTSEVAPNIYRISIFAPQGNLQFNHFLVKADKPLLFHTVRREAFNSPQSAECAALSLKRPASETLHNKRRSEMLAASQPPQFSALLVADCRVKSGATTRFAVPSEATSKLKPFTEQMVSGEGGEGYW